MPRLRYKFILRALLLSPALAQAQPSDMITAIRGMRWADARAVAARYPDPVVSKLATYYRLIAPGTASATEIAAFIAASPDWPFQATLAHRRDEALSAEPDDRTAADLCDAAPPTLAVARTRCAEASQQLARPADAAAMARLAWLALDDDPAREAAFLNEWGAALGPADQWARFDRLAWEIRGRDDTAARRQATRLEAADRPVAEAWLALRRDTPGAGAMLAALPTTGRDEPAIMLEHARWLRRAGRDTDALALWRAAGSAAEAGAPAEQRQAFWTERDILARRRLREADADGAYALVSGHAQTAPAQVADAEFLAGFIALRRLGRPDLARPHFNALTASASAITQARAHYWLARAAPDAASAQAEYRRAADWPNTFYGQLGALAAGEDLAQRIRTTHDPSLGQVADADRALHLAGRELARAAIWLVAWGDAARARAFLLRLADSVTEPVDEALAARLAAAFGMPEMAVAIARRAGRHGTVLLDTGWPAAAPMPPDVPPRGGYDAALMLGIVRQESSFDGATTSPAGARGLMQLMPGTAAQVARGLGLTDPVPALLADDATNVRLGLTYVRGLLYRYGGSVPLALAAYNAGPARVTEWLAQNGDPRATGLDMSNLDLIDWIELIPFGETRNYVQRVIENTVIYQARRDQAAAEPVATRNPTNWTR